MVSILITSANRGIGLEFVRQLAGRDPRPAHLFAACRRPDEVRDLLTLAAANDNIRVIELNVRNESTYQFAVEAVSNVVGEKGLNVLINNAGVKNQEGYAEMSRESFEEVLDANVISLLRVTQVFLPLLRQAAWSSNLQTFSFERATIINISSILGSISKSTGGLAGYRESKAAVNMLTKGLSVELRGDRILVLAQHPGWVQTDMGGSNADVTTEQSVSTMLRIFSAASEKENGLFLDLKFPMQICPY
ncbi:C-signal-like [Diadema antillarum]|uniref:C-signal-like n=1 Tax=Diadema antillarum TaxID=105358 RepID=UPI003A863351